MSVETLDHTIDTPQDTKPIIHLSCRFCTPDHKALCGADTRLAHPPRTPHDCVVCDGLIAPHLASETHRKNKP
jgi:hypothetical protein